MQPLVPIDFTERTNVFLAVFLILEPVEKMCAPLLSGDALPVERLDVVFHVWQKVLETANSALKVEKEVRALKSAGYRDCRDQLTFSYGTWL